MLSLCVKSDLQKGAWGLSPTYMTYVISLVSYTNIGAGEHLCNRRQMKDCNMLLNLRYTIFKLEQRKGAINLCMAFCEQIKLS